MTSDDHPARVAIIGGGFSGTLMALRLAVMGVRSVLIEQRTEAGRGLAYGTHDPIHLLNVPAAKMSAWPERLDDFAAFVSSDGAAPGDFVSRRRFGDYLSAQLNQAVLSGQVTLIHGQATVARREGARWAVTLAGGRMVQANTLILATGNARPDPFVVPGLPENIMAQDPWAPNVQPRLAAAATEGAAVLLIGTGLTMVDILLSLESLGHRGPVTAVSRRGLVPRAHDTSEAMAPPEPAEIPERLSDAVHWLRERGGETNWRGAVDSLRPLTQRLWSNWPDAVRARFLRHARPWWDVHRHRIAPAAAKIIEARRVRGDLTVIAGRVIGGEPGRAWIAPRGKAPLSVPVALVVNCTGPREQLSASRNALVRQMLADGLIAPGPMGMGVATDAQGWAGDNLIALGPLVKGEYWEITAVPDIRAQIASITGKIAKATK